MAPNGEEVGEGPPIGQYKSKALLRFRNPSLEQRFITSFHQQCARADTLFCIFAATCYGLLLLRVNNNDLQQGKSLLSWKPMHEGETSGSKDVAIVWCLLKLLWSAVSLLLLNWPSLSTWYLVNRSALLTVMDVMFWLCDLMYYCCHDHDFGYTIYRQIFVPLILPLGRTGPFRTVLPQRVFGLLLSLWGTFRYRSHSFFLGAMPFIITGHGLAMIMSYGIDLWFRAEFVRKENAEAAHNNSFGSAEAIPEGGDQQFGGLSRGALRRRHHHYENEAALLTPEGPPTDSDSLATASIDGDKSHLLLTTYSRDRELQPDLPIHVATQTMFSIATTDAAIPSVISQRRERSRRMVDRATQTPVWEDQEGFFVGHGANHGFPHLCTCAKTVCNKNKGMNQTGGGSLSLSHALPSGPERGAGLPRGGKGASRFRRHGAELACGGADVARGSADVAQGGVDMGWGGGDIGWRGGSVAWGGADVAGPSHLGADVARLSHIGADVAWGGADVAGLSHLGADVARLSDIGADVAWGGADVAPRVRVGGVGHRNMGAESEGVEVLGDAVRMALEEERDFRSKVEEEWERRFKLVEHKLASMKDPWRPIIHVPQFDLNI